MIAQQLAHGLTAVVPAYNEALTIGEVLAPLGEAPVVTQIIVVDDGSNDETGAAARAALPNDPRLQVLRLLRNQGKAGALLAGAAAARHEVLLFLDADLCGLRPEHIARLSAPVLEEDWAMSVGLFRDGRWQTNLTHRLFPFLSGQRCLRWPLFHEMPRAGLNGWSIETALNLHARRHERPLRYVHLSGLSHVMRTTKQAAWRGLWSHTQMWWQIGLYTANFLTGSGSRPAAAPARTGARRDRPQKWPV